MVMVNEHNHVIGYAMFSRFHLEGRYEKAKEMGYEAVIVEGNPGNYNPRGFETSYPHGIVAGPNLDLPAVECLMVKELVAGALKNIKGIVDYSDYECLS